MNKSRMVTLPLLILFAAIPPAFSEETAAIPLSEAQPVETQTGGTVQDAGAPPDNLPCNITLQQAQHTALEQNPTLQVVGEKVEQARAMARQARSAYYPQVQASFGVLYQWLSKRDRDELDGAIGYLRETMDDLDRFARGLGGAVPSRDLRSFRRDLRGADGYLRDRQDELDDAFEQYTYGVTAQYLVFDGFARKHLNAVARFGLEETRQGQREARRLLLDFVAQAYLGVQLARENLRVAEADRAFNAGILEDVEVMMEYGRAPLSSVLNFEVAVKAAEVRHITAQGDLEAAELALARLLGLEGVVWPEEWRLCPPGEVDAALLQKPDADIQLAYALEHRPDLHQKELSVERAGAEKKRRQGAYYPKIGVQVGLEDSFSYSRGLDFDGLAPQVGIGVSYDIFTGGRRRASVTEAEHARREAEWEARDALLTVQYEVRAALLELNTAQKRYNLLVDTVRTVRESRDLVTEEYRAGKESLTRLNQAQRDLVEAEGQLAFAAVALRNAWHTLDTATARSLGAFSQMDETQHKIETSTD